MTTDTNVDIDITDHVNERRLQGLTWTAICESLGCNTKWLQRWRSRNNYTDPRRPVNEDELDHLIQGYSKDHPNRGESTLLSHLARDNILATRQRVRDSIHRVDPEGVADRRSMRIQRVRYSVPGPHHVWHIDGNHKLKDFHMVIHGAIDGFSRASIFLHCSDNNRSETVKRHFLSAISKYGCPSRIRTDKGGENVLAADVMLQLRGTGRNSVLVGRSTHNQRIERFWRDVTKEVSDYYRKIFDHFESEYNILILGMKALYFVYIIYF